MDENFSRHVLLCMDAKGYSDRGDVEQHRFQKELVDVVTTAADVAGLCRERWDVQGSGDGELDVLPSDVAEWTVIDRFPAALANALSTVNACRAPDARVRMRLGIHHGLVQRAAGGFAGNGVVTVARIVDSDLARDALLACPTADLVVLLSSSLYNEVVVQRHTTLLSTSDFREVPIHTKKFRDTAWLHIPGHDVHALRLAQSTKPEDRAEPVPVGIPTTVNNVHQPRAERMSFGGVQNNFG